MSVNDTPTLPEIECVEGMSALDRELEENEKTYSLLIWEMVPEECLLYVIPNDVIDEVSRHVLRTAHTFLIDGERRGDEVAAALNYISLALSLDDGPGKWAQYKAGENTHIEARISHVYRSGCYL